MAKVLLVQPWNFHDEGIKKHDLSHEWRNGPYPLLLLAAQLRKNNHQVALIDMSRDLVAFKGNVIKCLKAFSDKIRRFIPDIIGFGFFSIHYFEVRMAVETARKACRKNGIRPVFIAGGIHASIEPESTIKDLCFDYAFVGEADLGILQLADGVKPQTIPGIIGPDTEINTKGEELKNLDLLPFPDWSLCDYRFYSYPSYGKIKTRKSKSLDMMMGRGCVYQCSFCAYNVMSKVRFYSAEYLLDQMNYMVKEYDVNAIYFTDSSVGNNQTLLREFCELMIRKGIPKSVEWYANIRSNQVDEELLKLMWKAGCRFLLYGFESGSQRVLDLMNKRVDLDDNLKAVELHNKLKFPFHASMIMGYPGEKEEDALKSIEFIKQSKAPIVGVNWYVPLPGSPDYERLKKKGDINIDDPSVWRRIGEVNPVIVYADMPEKRFRELFAEATRIVTVGIPRTVYPSWAGD